jgi:hypothetical protein
MLSTDNTLRVAVKIWHNESNGTITGLTSWNKGEPFASLGVGHFTWHPTTHHSQRALAESFPSLIKYIEQQGIMVPPWLQGETVPSCPWANRNAFITAQNDPKMQELRLFLLQTIPLQAEFIVRRLQATLAMMLHATPKPLHPYIRNQFSMLTQTPQGLYALIDYTNFKGTGV